MRKILTLFASIILIVSVACIVSYADATSDIYFNGNPVNFGASPRVVDGCTLVPARDLADAMGLDCSWDAATDTVILTNASATAWIQVGNPVVAAMKNNIMFSERSDASAVMTEGKTFVPLRIVAEIFDAVVSWNGDDNSVRLTTSAPLPDYETVIDEDAIANAWPEDAIDAPEPVYPEPEAPVKEYSPADSAISLSGFTPPENVRRGSAFVLGGTINSALPLDRVNVKITDTNTGAVEVNETSFNLTDREYSLSVIDSRVKFGVLTAGSKLLQITAVDTVESRQEFKYDFSVTYPEGVPVKNSIPMLWPVPSSGLITTIFWCDNPFCHSNAGRVNGHAALDIAANGGEDVIAVADGVVKLQGFGSYDNGKTGYGYFVLLDHGNGLETQYAHLSAIYVTDGQKVTAGTPVGAIGSTGNSTGNHLDFYITQDGKRCDPLYYLDMHPNVRVHESCDKPFFDKAMKSRGIK